MEAVDKYEVFVFYSSYDIYLHHCNIFIREDLIGLNGERSNPEMEGFS